MKNYLVLSAAATLCTAAFPQSSATVYGKFDYSLNSLNYSATSKRPGASLVALSTDSSFFGFRGTEDLGGGMRAYFKVEYGFQMEGTTSIRESYVGLTDKSLGTLQIGLQNSPAVAVSRYADVFNRSGLGSFVPMFQGGRGFPVVYTNAVHISPTVSGFTGKLLFSPSEGVPLPGTSRAAALQYASGPGIISLLYDQSNAEAESVGLSGGVVQKRNFSVGGKYDFGPVKISGWLLQNQIDGIGNSTGVAFGASIPVGKSEFRTSYIQRRSPNAEAKQFAVGYHNPLSRRTALYTQVAKIQNSGVSAFGLGPARAEAAAGGLTAGGRKILGIQLGVFHTF